MHDLIRDPVELLVPCTGGGNTVGWFRVREPLPVEIHADDGVYVLDERNDADGVTALEYVFMPPA